VGKGSTERCVGKGARVRALRLNGLLFSFVGDGLDVYIYMANLVFF
jgi:hypothetical protein